MELIQTTVTKIPGIKRWCNIVELEQEQRQEQQQYILEHISRNGSQIATLYYDESKHKHQTIACNQIHDKFGKYLKMCQMNSNGNIVIFVLENADIIKWSINEENSNEITIIPAVPQSNKRNEYEIIKISECGESLLVALKDAHNEKMNIVNIWIYNVTLQKWFNTQYEKEIDDGFKSFKYYNKSWYVIDIAADTSMTYELNISIHKLCVIVDDKISEISNQDILVYTDGIISIDLSQFKQYLTNKIHKILYDLSKKLIVLLFDEFIIWISIKSDLNKPLYVLSLIPMPNDKNIKFKDMVFLLNKMLVAVITNHGSIIFYQRLSEKPIPLNYHQNNTCENILTIAWKKISDLHSKNSYKSHNVHSTNDSKLFFSNGHTMIHYKIQNFKLKYFALNWLPFIQSNMQLNDLNEYDVTDQELTLIRNILCFKMRQVLKSDETDTCLMDSLLWFINCDSVWQYIFIDVIKNNQNALKNENILKIIKICNNYFDWVSKCLEVEINAFYQEVETLIDKNGIGVLQFNWKELFCADYVDNNNSTICNKLYSNIILLMFEDPKKIVTNQQIDNLIDILWKISKLNQIYRKNNPQISKINILPLDCINNKTSQIEKLKKWMDLQLNDIMNEMNVNKQEATNKQEFAKFFWKKISENQQNLIVNNKTKTDDIIHNLIDIISLNIGNRKQFKQNLKIRKTPLLSIYCNGEREEYYNSEIELEEIEQIEEKSKYDSSSPQIETIEEKSKCDSASPQIGIELQLQTDVAPFTNVAQQKSIESTPNTPITTNKLLLNEQVNNAEIGIIGYNESNCKESRDNMDIKMNFDDIAAYVPEKYILDRLANNLTKQELIQIFAKKIEIKQNKNNQNIEHQTTKWKLIEYDKHNNIIANKQISSKMQKKIKKYLRKKNKLIQMQHEHEQHQQQQLQPINTNMNSKSHDDLQNAELNNDQLPHKPFDEVALNNNNNKHNLTTTITNNTSFISNHNMLNENKYKLTMDTFDCVHIASSKTSNSQTTPSHTSHASHIAIDNWFVAPLLSNTQTKTCKEMKESEMQTKECEESEIQTTECKASEMQTAECEVDDFNFVSLPVIGARTAGLSYIDPSIQINKDNLMLKFPATHNFEQQLNTIEENKEHERNGKNSLLQSQCSLMMHSTAPSTIAPEDILHKNKVNTNLGEFEDDIATMDAQIANLSALCNNLQNNYYKIDTNINLDESKPIQTNRKEQIGSMEAWALLQTIQQNLNSIDHDINTINCNESKKHQLKHLKAKSNRKTRLELTENLEQQTNHLNHIYNNLV